MTAVRRPEVENVVVDGACGNPCGRARLSISEAAEAASRVLGDGGSVEVPGITWLPGFSFFFQCCAPRLFTRSHFARVVIYAGVQWDSRSAPGPHRAPTCPLPGAAPRGRGAQRHRRRRRRHRRGFTHAAPALQISAR